MAKAFRPFLSVLALLALIGCAQGQDIYLDDTKKSEEIPAPVLKGPAESSDPSGESVPVPTAPTTPSSGEASGSNPTQGQMPKPDLAKPTQPKKPESVGNGSGKKEELPSAPAPAPAPAPRTPAVTSSSMHFMCVGVSRPSYFTDAFQEDRLTAPIHVYDPSLPNTTDPSLPGEEVYDYEFTVPVRASRDTNVFLMDGKSRWKDSETLRPHSLYLVKGDLSYRTGEARRLTTLPDLDYDLTSLYERLKLPAISFGGSSTNGWVVVPKAQGFEILSISGLRALATVPLNTNTHFNPRFTANGDWLLVEGKRPGSHRVIAKRFRVGSKTAPSFREESLPTAQGHQLNLTQVTPGVWAWMTVDGSSRALEIWNEKQVSTVKIPLESGSAQPTALVGATLSGKTVVVTGHEVSEGGKRTWELRAYGLDGRLVTKIPYADEVLAARQSVTDLGGPRLHQLWSRGSTLFASLPGVWGRIVFKYQGGEWRRITQDECKVTFAVPQGGK